MSFKKDDRVTLTIEDIVSHTDSYRIFVMYKSSLNQILKSSGIVKVICL